MNCRIRLHWTLRRLLLWDAVAFLLVSGVVGAASQAAPRTATDPVVAYIGAKVYRAPSTPAIPSATILVQGGRILDVGPAAAVVVPKGATVIRVDGLTAVAGLWNSHVHFFKPEWLDAANRPASDLTRHLRLMLTRYGFVHAVDTGSFLSNTLALRKRIQSGEVPGPAILTAGEPLYPKNGLPEVAKSITRKAGLPDLPEVATPDEARAWAERHLADGADLLKVFSGAGYSGHVTVMPPAVIRAVVEAAHAKGKRVAAHPQNVAGRRAAVEGGVDLLGHTPDPSGEDNAEMVRVLAARRIAVTPTLKLWGVDVPPDWTEAQRQGVLERGIGEVRLLRAAGAVIIFGTDVGYMDDPDPRDEYRDLLRAGLSFDEILASATTTPARFFGLDHETGRIAAKMSADIVFLGTDPGEDAIALADVRLALLDGRVVFDSVRDLGGLMPPGK